MIAVVIIASVLAVLGGFALGKKQDDEFSASFDQWVKDGKK